MADFDMTWAKMDPGHVPPEIDTTRPSVARVYDAILGGKDNFAVDRAVAAAAVKTMGDDGNGARLNRAALGRAVRYMVSQGVDQFLDLGSGLPTVQNTHQIAQTIEPRRARGVRGQRPERATCTARRCSPMTPRRPWCSRTSRRRTQLLAMKEVSGFLDFGKPVGLIMNAVIHHVLDEEDPYGIVDRYKRGACPGQLPRS